MTAEIRDGVIIATEHIRATPDIVFPYFTDPTLMVAWIGERAELDRRPGGVFTLDFGELAVVGAYLSLEPPHRLVFSWGIAGNETLPAGASTVEVVLTPDGDDTLVVLTHRGLPAARLDDHRSGWAERLSHLPSAVAGRPRPGQGETSDKRCADKAAARGGDGRR